MSHYYAKFKENPCVGTDASTPFGVFMESWILRVCCKVSEAPKYSWFHASGASLTLQETRSIHVSMSIPKIEFIAYIYILL